MTRHTLESHLESGGDGLRGRTRCSPDRWRSDRPPRHSDPGSTSPHDLGIEQKVDPAIADAPSSATSGSAPTDCGEAPDLPGRRRRHRGRPRGRGSAPPTPAPGSTPPRTSCTSASPSRAPPLPSRPPARRRSSSTTPSPTSTGWQASLDARARSAAPGAVPSWYVDVPGNRVVVLAKPGAERAARQFVAQARRRPSPLAEQRPRTMYDIRGGDQYVINGNTLLLDRLRGGRRFRQRRPLWRRRQPHARLQQRHPGHVRRLVVPRQRLLLGPTNGNWTPQPWVNNYSGGNVLVAGSHRRRDRQLHLPLRLHHRLALRHPARPNETVDYAQGAVSGLSAATPAPSPATPAAPGSPATRHRASPPAAPATARSGGTTCSSRSTRSSRLRPVADHQRR